MEAEILLAHVLNVDRLQLYLAPEKPLTSEERGRYRTVVKRRREGVPLQHLTGEISFYGLKFRVNGDALIPRAETEELLDRVLQLAPRDREVACLDLGTGSGVIAVCLARYLPRATVTAVDISSEALQLARVNASLNEVEERICFFESDWFGRVSGRFDLIASNPPYVDERELSNLPCEVREHEPRCALDGGTDGLEQISLLLRNAVEHLAAGGYLLLEIDHRQGRRIVEMMGEVGLADIQVEQDLAGKDRFAVARCPS